MFESLKIVALMKSFMFFCIYRCDVLQKLILNGSTLVKS